jgi:uridine kinase
MDQYELSKKVNDAVILWAQGTDKLVVAIDGYTGIGKTTLLYNLAKLNSDIVAVNLDDFLFPREIFRPKLINAEDKSKMFEFEVCDDKKLGDFITTFKNTKALYEMDAYNGVTGKLDTPRVFDFSKKIMVVEGVFMFHPELVRSKFWDKRIYLQGDVDQIAERRIKREKERWGKDYISETNPNSYFKQVCIALDRYIASHHPEKIADLVLKVD